jgi:hypothetical protein
MHIIALIFTLVLAISFVLFSNPQLLLAHTFSENENALFLTLVDKIKAETQLVGRDSSNNTQQAQAHANGAASLLTQNDPVVNTTWTKEISERNPRVSIDLMNSLSDLKNSASPSPSSVSSSSVQSKVANIANLLDEAVSVRIDKALLNNPKTQALVIANLGNEIYNNYGNALGLSPTTIASMGGMKMSGMNMNTPAKSNATSGMSGMSMGSKGSSMSMSTGSSVSGGMSGMSVASSKGLSGMNSMSGQAAINQSNPTIKNMTAYETAQSLAYIAQQAFGKNLKPIAPANATSSTTSIENYIGQLKNAIDTKASFTNVMELVHIRLHPTLMTAYNLTTG